MTLYQQRQACGMREKGLTVREIAAELGASPATVVSLLGGQRRGERSPIPPAANDNNKTWCEVANNGGCSTLSGMVRVSLARVATLEQEAA